MADRGRGTDSLFERFDAGVADECIGMQNVSEMLDTHVHHSFPKPSFRARCNMSSASVPICPCR
jgi:hypothetical protein